MWYDCQWDNNHKSSNDLDVMFTKSTISYEQFITCMCFYILENWFLATKILRVDFFVSGSATNSTVRIKDGGNDI